MHQDDVGKHSQDLINLSFTPEAVYETPRDPYIVFKPTKSHVNHRANLQTKLLQLRDQNPTKSFFVFGVLTTRQPIRNNLC